jgi:N-terminal acetyltransferase B complex catalytic subunit
MTTQREFTLMDAFKFNGVNLDLLTETYTMNFYAPYVFRWPDYQQLLEHPTGRIMAYILGKAEGQKKLWHGHVTAVTVAPPYRRLRFASQLMALLEKISEDVYNCFFVDLFVRNSNVVAVDWYTQMGYIVYRTVLGYYSGPDGEDGLDMHKALRRDERRESMVPLKRPITPDELEFD